jgi:hypothetical protein
MSKIPAQILLVDTNGEEQWVVNINSLNEDQLIEDGMSREEMKFEEDVQEELSWISEIIEWSGNLTPEVVQFGLLNMKRNPELSPAQALIIGYKEWVK